MTHKSIPWYLVAICSLLLLADQYSKIYIQLNVVEPIPVIQGFFSIVHVRNTGAAWGMFAGKSHLLFAVSILVLILIFAFSKTLTEGFIERYYSLAFICAGIAGNSIDRLWYGAVVDFLDFQFKGSHWPAFNVADSSIFIGVAIYIASSLFREQKNGDTAKAGETPACNSTGCKQ